jgi:hypothetical protein
MTSFFLVFSPFQMLNAIEARHSLHQPDDRCHLVFCRGVSEKNAEHIKNLIQPEDWASVQYLAQLENRKTLRERRASLEQMWRSAEPVDRLIVGHFAFALGRHLANTFRPAEVVVLDDGTASHRIFDNRFRVSVPAGGKEPSRWVPDFARLFAARVMFGVRASPYRRATFFSIYSHRVHPCDILTRNDYGYLRSKITGRVQKKQVYFLGGCLPDLGIVTEQFYLSSLSTVAEHFAGQSIVYFPHRREDPVRLQKIQERCQCEIRSLDVPFEQFLLTAEILPEVIASFYSTALDSCRLLFRDQGITIKAFRLPEDQINGEEQRSFVRLVYDYYTNSYGEGFEVIPLA